MQAILACEKQEQRDPYRQILINCGVDCGAEDAVIFGDLAARTNRGGAELLVVLLGKEAGDNLKLVERIHAKSALPILVFGPSHDAELIMHAMKAGARDYLDVNHPRESLTQALEKLRQSGSIQFHRGRCIVVTGASPGCGVTTVALGLAFALGGQHPQQVILGEIGAGVPELALDLDLQPRYSASQLLQDWNRVDASTVRQAALEHAAGIFLLADSPASQIPVADQTDACKQLISLVRTMYHYAVYDIGHAAQTPLAQQALRMADQVVLVVRLDVPGLRLTRSMMNRLTDLGVSPQQLTLAANRYGQRKQIGWRKVEEALGVPVNVWLPDDPGTVNQAKNLGLPLTQISSWSKFNRRLNDLAQQVAGPVRK